MTRVTIMATALAVPAGRRAQKALFERHQEVVSEQLWTQRGLQVAAGDDGIVAIFPEAQAAVRCAVAIQSSGGVVAGIGIHAGSALWQDGEVSGPSVSEALRLTSLAECGEILVSDDVVRRLTRPGEFSIAGVREWHRVLWGDER
jgi:class 3 adenylate cyclase